MPSTNTNLVRLTAKLAGMGVRSPRQKARVLFGLPWLPARAGGPEGPIVCQTARGVIAYEDKVGEDEDGTEVYSAVREYVWK